MRYERPSIVRRERIGSLLADSAPSDKKQKPGTGNSDVHVKANIQAVTWAGETVAYAKPEVAAREALEGFLIVTPSDKKNDGAPSSDVHVKEHIVPVRW